MRAAVFHGARDVRVEEIAEPDAPGPRQVTVRPSWCGICGTDLHEYLAGPIYIPEEPHPLTGTTYPQILGHEFSAIVEAIGSDVTNVAVGDRVSIMPLIVCGRCGYCVRGLNHLCKTMAATGLSSKSGGFSERTVLEDYQVTRIPDSVSDVQGALIEPAAVAAYGVDRAHVRPGEVVLVTGMGPIGALVSLYAAAAGLDVVMAEPNLARAEFARRLDIGEVLDPAAGGAQDRIMELTDGLGVAAAIECSGNEAALNTAILAVRSQGAVVQTGLFTGTASIPPAELSIKDVSLIGSWCYPVTDWPRMIRLLASGRFPVERIVTSQIPIDDVVVRGFDALTDPNGREVKVLVSATA